MSTSGSAQLESESHVTNGHGHHSSVYHCHYGENGEVDCERSKGCDYHETNSSSGHNTHSARGLV